MLDVDFRGDGILIQRMAMPTDAVPVSIGH
jgi:hypothetical protein